jgi:hypothetical protein
MLRRLFCLLFWQRWTQSFVTPSILPIILAEMDTIFNTKATVNPELTNNPVTFPAILEKQNVNIDPLFVGAGERCTGVRVIYQIADVTTLPTSSATPIAGECDLTTGDRMSTKAVEYDFNTFIKPSIQVNDEDCDNLVKYAQRVAFLLAQKMHLITRTLNEDAITLLETNKSVADPALGVDDVTVVAGEYTITGAQFWKGEGAADTLAIFDQMARKIGLPNNYYIISGTALRVPYDLARDKSVNDNQRSFALTFQRRDIYWDEDNLDVIAGAECVYLVDPNAIVFYPYAEYPQADANLTGDQYKWGDKNNTLRFSLPLQYYNMYQDGDLSMMPVMFANNGQMEQVYIDVRYQKTCNSTDTKYGKPSLDHVWELDFVGLLDVIPKEGDNSGIVRVNKAI